tara:strand:+ start:350 stop:691 length:342 start_codon:yes stop_codon:yes gene_type:complete
MEKILYFSEGGGDNAAGEVMAWPVSSFLGFDIAGADTTSLQLNFKPQTDDADSVDVVDLTITAGTIKKVIKGIYAAINKPGVGLGDGFIVVADVTNSEFCHPDITACAISEDS